MLAGAVFLLAMQPALVSARSAPRLWGWLLFGWLLSLAASELLHAHVRVTPAEFSNAQALLPSAAVLCVGLGLGATALSGPRRPYVAWAVALGLACLTHGNGRPWKGAAAAAAELRADLARAREELGAGPIVVLDPPAPIRGVDPLGGALAWLLHPELDGAKEEGVAAPEVRGLSAAAFLALVREPEFAALVSRPLIVLTPPDAVAEAGRRALLFGPPSPSAPVQAWQGSLRSPPLDLDPLETAALRATVPIGTDVESLGRVSWLTSEDSDPELLRSLQGVWLPIGEELVGVFDLGGSLAWRLAGRVRLLLFEAGTRPIDRGDLLAELPALGELAPRVDGGDWLFARPESRLVQVGSDRGHFVLGLLSLADFSYAELHARSEGGELRFPGAAVVGRAEAPLAWSLDYRIGERTVARARGRRP